MLVYSSRISTDYWGKEVDGMDVSQHDSFFHCVYRWSLPREFFFLGSLHKGRDLPMEVEVKKEVEDEEMQPETSKRGERTLGKTVNKRMKRRAEIITVRKWISARPGRSSASKAVGWMMEGRGDHNGQLNNFSDYMRLKKDKLLHQVNVISRLTTKSQIFEGISIFVNGYTVPSSLQLRNMIQTHGGEFHVYYEPGVTTYTVASDIAVVKRSAMRKGERVVRPNLIVDSLGAGKLLDDSRYLLLEDNEEKKNTKGTLTQIVKNAEEEKVEGEKDHVVMDARDDSFIDAYYARSRLHLISTLAQQMRDHVSSLREEEVDFSECHQELKLAMRMEEGTKKLPDGEKCVFHIDLDCFFVSVSLRSRPELKGKAVAVTHSSGSRERGGFSEVASCSYEARDAGVRNGCLVRDALNNCPHLVCIPYEFDEYRQVSKCIYDIVARFTRDIRAVSCDEMYIDATQLCLNGTDPLVVANVIREHIRNGTACAASIGIGPNPLVARLSTRIAKPDGVKWTQQSEVKDFLASRKICDLPGVGYSTMHRLKESFGDMEYCRELQMIDRATLESGIGVKGGSQLYRLCRGIDDSFVLKDSIRKSVSCDINYGIRFTKEAELHKFLGNLAVQLEKKLLSARVKAGTMTMKVMVRSSDAPVQTAKYLGHGRCDTHNKCVRLNPPLQDNKILCEEAIKLMNQIKAPIEDLRGIGVQLTKLVPISSSNAKCTVNGISKFFAPVLKENEGEGEKEGMEEGEEGGEEGEGEEGREEDGEGGGGNEDLQQERIMREFEEREQEMNTGFSEPVSLLRPTIFPSTRYLFGKTDDKGHLGQLMTQDPSLTSIQYILSHSLSLMESGQLCKLKSLVLNMEKLMTYEFAEGWILTSRLLWSKIEEIVYKRYGITFDLMETIPNGIYNWNQTEYSSVEEEDCEKQKL